VVEILIRVIPDSTHVIYTTAITPSVTTITVTTTTTIHTTSVDIVGSVLFRFL
jgi:hypothetical protein